MSKSALYAINESTQAVSSGNPVALNYVVRKYGPNISLNSNVMLDGAGYYIIAADVDYTAEAAGPVTFTINRDGAEIPGASSTLTAALDTVYNANIVCIDREFCPCCGPSTISIVPSADVSVSNASIVVCKL